MLSCFGWVVKLVNEILNKILNYALKSGAHEAEVYLKRSKERVIKGEGEKLIPTSSNNTNIAIRVSVGKRVGSVFTTTLDLKKLYEEVDRAISIARVSDEDPYWVGLPDQTKPTANVVYNEELAQYEISEMMKICKKIYEESKKYDVAIKIYELYNGVSIWERWVLNSRGVEAYDRGSNEHFVIMVKGKDVKREISIYDGWVDIKPIEDKIELMLQIVKRVKKLYNAAKLEKAMKTNVIFSPSALAKILLFVFSPAIRADNVQEGRSPLHDKLNKEIGSKNLNILDDGTLFNGLSTSKYDDEGVAKRKTIIVKDGVLKEFLYNHYYARKENRESTGNAIRSGSVVGINYTNLIFNGNNKSIDDLISSVDSGVYVEGLPLNPHSSNYITGEINAVLYEAYLIKSGSIEKPLLPLNISGNIYEAFTDMKVAGKPEKTMFSIYLPYVLLPNVTVL